MKLLVTLPEHLRPFSGVLHYGPNSAYPFSALKVSLMPQPRDDLELWKAEITRALKRVTGYSMAVTHVTIGADEVTFIGTGFTLIYWNGPEGPGEGVDEAREARGKEAAQWRERP